MTLAAQFDFTRTRQVAMTVSELDLPPHPDDAGEGQSYAMHPGDRFTLYSADGLREACCRVEAWIDSVRDEPRRVRLENMHSGSPIYLTGWQVSFLESQRRIKPLATRPGIEDGNPVPGLSLAMGGMRLQRAQKNLGYVQAVLDDVELHNLDRLPRARIKKVIAAHAASLGVRPPDYRTVKKHILKVLDRMTNDVLLAVADRPHPGNTDPRFCRQIEEALAGAAEHAWRMPKGTWRHASKEFLRLITAMRADGTLPFRGASDDVALPGDSTIYRRMYAVNHYDRCRLRFGDDVAERLFARYIQQQLPDTILDIVDIDHTTLNIVVIDDRFPVAYGRPDLLVFRDRKSGSVCGFTVGFDNPSYESFLHGLRHSVYPKDMSAFPGLTWRQYGFGRRYGVDNAVHLIGDNIKEAAKQLRFQIVEYRPGHPWEKGALERLFGILNFDLIENLPGATTHSPTERKKYDETKEKAVPKLLLSELDAFLSWYFCHEHNANPHQGLGFLRTLKGIPDEIWKAEIGRVKQRHPIDPSIFVRLAGDVERRTIGPLGIRVDHIIYQSAELLVIEANPKHKPGKGRHCGTRYRVVRDPNDLGRVWVEDPYLKRMVEIPACASDYAYANGLRLFQHAKVVKYWQKTHKRDPESGEELLQAMEDYEASLAEFHRHRRQHGTALKLARFFSKQKKRLERGRLVEAVPVEEGSGRMNIASPDATLPMLPRSERAQPTSLRSETVGAYTVPAAVVPGTAHQSALSGPKAILPPADDDIETLKSKYDGY